MKCDCELCLLLRAMPGGSTLEVEETNGRREWWYRMADGGVSIGDSPEEAFAVMTRMRGMK